MSPLPLCFCIFLYLLHSSILPFMCLLLCFSWCFLCFPFPSLSFVFLSILHPPFLSSQSHHHHYTHTTHSPGAGFMVAAPILCLCLPLQIFDHVEQLACLRTLPAFLKSHPKVGVPRAWLSLKPLPIFSKWENLAFPSKSSLSEAVFLHLIYQ